MAFRHNQHDQEIRSLRENDKLSLQHIADSLCISRSSVRRSLLAQGLPIDGPNAKGSSKLDAHLEAITADYVAGLALSHLTVKYNCDWMTLRKFLKAHNLDSRKGWLRNTAGRSFENITPEEHAEVVAIYKEGNATVRDIAKRLSSTVHTVYNILLVNDVPMREAHTRKKTDDEKRETVLKRTYGITLAELRGTEAAQGGKCAICGCDPESPRNHGGSTLAVDHDHINGKFRGLLCKNCNMLVGLAADSAEILAQASAYMLRANSVVAV